MSEFCKIHRTHSFIWDRWLWWIGFIVPSTLPPSPQISLWTNATKKQIQMSYLGFSSLRGLTIWAHFMIFRCIQNGHCIRFLQMNEQNVLTSEREYRFKCVFYIWSILVNGACNETGYQRKMHTKTRAEVRKKNTIRQPTKIRISVNSTATLGKSKQATTWPNIKWFIVKSTCEHLVRFASIPAKPTAMP